MIIYMYTHRYQYRYMSVNKWMVSRIHQAIAIKPTRFVSAKHTLSQGEQITEAAVAFENLPFAPLDFLTRRDQMCLCLLMCVQPLDFPSFNFVGFGTTAG